MTPRDMLLTLFGVRPVSLREIRAEAFFLGNRHKGQIVEGARKELRAAGLHPDRAALLRAVIRMAPSLAGQESRP